MFAPLEPIYTVAGIRSIEARVAPEAEPTLMERAGRAAAEEAFRLTMERPGPVLIACGPGNNGGDGFVMARRLLQAGRSVVVAFAGHAEALPADARCAFDAWREAGGETFDHIPPTPEEGWALIADALFGIGLQRPIEGRYAEWIRRMNGENAPRLALDIPSGLDANTGCKLGQTFLATHTLTFIALKPGLLTMDGPDYAGQITVRNLDIDPGACIEAEAYKIRPALFRDHLRPRAYNSHKGTYGEVGIIGGAAGMDGAALLGAKAALKLGAGRILVGLLDSHALTVDPSQPELMLRSPDAVIAHSSVLVVGPGLGTSTEAQRLLALAIEQDTRPLLLDADGLNLIALDPELAEACTHRDAPLILTPHPGEASRLLATDTDSVQADRVASALELARRYNADVVLKGCGTVIATARERWYINCTGHPGMASAGMGDALTGLIAALLAQGWPSEIALIAAIHLHGAAADRLAREGIGPIGLTASEVIEAARGVFNGWVIQAGNPR